MSKSIKRVLSVLFCAALLLGAVLPGGAGGDLSIKASGAALSSIISAGPEGNVIAGDTKNKVTLTVTARDCVSELKLVQQGGATEIWTESDTTVTDNGDGTKTWARKKKYLFNEGKYDYTAYAKVDGAYEANGVDFKVNATKTTVRINLSTTGLGGFVAYYNGGTPKTMNSTSGDIVVAVGDVVTLVAKPKSINGYTYDLLFWSKMNPQRVIGTESTYKFVATSAMNIGAQFSPNAMKDDLGYKYLVYMNQAGNVLVNVELPSGASYYEVPDGPALQDHTFKRWSMEPEEVFASEKRTLVVTPVYELTESYTVTIPDGDYETGGAGVYVCADNERKLVNVSASARNGAGQAFQYWLDGDTNEIVSYSRGYLFYAIKDVTLCPVYGDEAVTPQPVVRIAAVKFSNARVSFFAERSVPGAYKVLQTGIILTKSEEFGTDSARFVIGGTGVYKGTANSKSADGFYSCFAKIEKGETCWGRAYLTYRDAAGEIFTLYSPVSSYTR